MKVAFYLENRAIRNVDCTDVVSGNPGIGGTQYMILLVATMLSSRENGMEIILYTEVDGKLPDGLNYCVTGDFLNTVHSADKDDVTYLVFRHNASLIKDGTLAALRTSTKLIVWDHVFVCYWELDYYAKDPNIFKIINVGREMNDLYRDHPAFKKSCYIYNCVQTSGAEMSVKSHPFNERDKIVTYIGSIVPFKGFHLLAQAWPEVIEKEPTAQLYVIGSGKLYNQGGKMGQYGIAEESYEKLIMQYLTRDGALLDSVHFMGILGKDKNEILLRTKVGVPNPSGITETFCISAVEMQLMGAVVTTIKAPGYLDTVRNGHLFGRAGDLAHNIIELLNSNESDYSRALSYFESNFSPESVIPKWEELFLKGTVKYDNSLSNPSYRLKWLKESLRKMSIRFPFIYRINPTVERLYLFVERLVKGRITYIDS